MKERSFWNRRLKGKTKVFMEENLILKTWLESDEVEHITKKKVQTYLACNEFFSLDKAQITLIRERLKWYFGARLEKKEHNLIHHGGDAKCI